MSKIIGIDLGTTNSEVSVLENGSVAVIDTGEGPILPSCVGIDGQGAILVGQPARNQLTVRPESTVLSIKRKMGGAEAVKLGDRSFSPEEISAIILRELKRRAEKHIGQAVEKAVITVPAYFNDAQRNATRNAGLLAGLDVVRIINEPTAASLAYDAGHTGNEVVLVYDLGGGTFDASLVVIENGVVEVKASHGDTMLGGDDFDRLIMDHASKRIQDANGVTVTGNLLAERRLLVACEQAKRRLSDEPFTRIREEFLIDNINCDFELTREDYEAMIEPLVRKTIGCVHQCLRDAAMLPSALQKIILVGGSSRTPLVQRMLEKELGLAPRFEINPDLIVSMGAGILGGRIAGEETKAVLVDITPHTFGTSALDDNSGMFSPDKFVPIIHRNTPLPAHKAEIFYTVVDDQERVDVHIYQGENPKATENVLVGHFLISGLKGPAGNPIVLHLDLDLNGILKVTATEKHTGLSKTVTMDTKARGRRFDLEASRDNLEALLGGDIADEAQFEEVGSTGSAPHLAVVKAKEMKKRAEKLLAALGGDDAAEVLRLLEQSRKQIEAGDIASLGKTNESLSDMLFYLED